MGVLTVRQAAERLQVAAATIYDLCARKVLRHIRVGRGRGTLRIREDDLDAFVETATVQPDIPAAPRPRSATSAPPGGGCRFRHVRWSDLPDSPPGGVAHS